MAARHGTRSKYVAGCRCDPCCIAEANYQKKRRQNKKAAAVSNVVTLNTGMSQRVGGDDLNGRTEPIPGVEVIGPVEQGVIDALAKVPAAVTARPDLAASARAMARIQDNPVTVAQATNAAARMLTIMEQLMKGSQKKRKLASVRNITNPTAATG